MDARINALTTKIREVDGAINNARMQEVSLAILSRKNEKTELIKFSSYEVSLSEVTPA